MATLRVRGISRKFDICRPTRWGKGLVALYADDIPDFDRDQDLRIRTAVFDWLTSQVAIHGHVLPRRLLAGGFEFENQRIHLIGPQGIFKPAAMQVPISITTSPSGPYDDDFGSDSELMYRYRGTDRNHRDNVGLRFAMKNQLPLVYFRGAVPGRYVTVWPVYVISDSPDTLTFSAVVDDKAGLGQPYQSPTSTGQIAEIRREYVTTVERRRIHQRVFREQVLHAYNHQCTLCNLRHSELLDAAHIIPDSEPDGEPVVSNGLSLCRLHHAAFDRFFLGVRPDHIIEVRPDVLEEADGPTLQHAIQGLHGLPITLPKRAVERPSSHRLEKRYARYQEKVAAL